MLEILQLCLICKFQDLKPLWGIIKLRGPGFAKPDRHLVMILSDTCSLLGLQ
jgi:hypothetical protein